MSRTVWGRYRLGEVIFAELEARRRELERRQREIARQAKAAEYRKKLDEGIEAASQRLAAWDKVKQKLIASDLLRLIDTETIEERVGSLKLSLSRCSSLKELAAVRSQIKRLEQDWSGLPERARAVNWDYYSELRENIETGLSEAEADLRAMQDDKVVAGWCGARLAELCGRIAGYNRLLLEEGKGRENFDGYLKEIESVAAEVKALSGELEKITDEAYEKEREETARGYVVRGMIDVLKGMGFVINQGPDLLNAEDPASSVVVAGNLPSGKRVEIKVNLNGAVYTDFNGYVADECLKDIATFKQVLGDQFVVDYEVRGEAPNNPDKIKKGAQEKPEGGKGQGSKTVERRG